MSLDETVFLEHGNTHFKLFENAEAEVRDFWSYANCPVKVGHDFTLEDFFTCLANSFMGWSGVRELNQFCCCSLMDLFIDLKKTPKLENDGQPLDYLEVFPVVSIDRYGKQDEPSDFHMYWGFHGWGTYTDKDLPPDTKGAYAIEMTPLAELKHLPLRINPKTELGHTAGPPKYVYTKLMDVQASPTLIEFVKAILWELSFFGTPENRDAKAAELTQTIKDIESGAVETVPWDGVKLRLEKILEDRKKTAKKAKKSKKKGKR